MMHFGTEILPSLGPKMCDKLASYSKSLNLLGKLKQNVKN